MWNLLPNNSNSKISPRVERGRIPQSLSQTVDAERWTDDAELKKKTPHYRMEHVGTAADSKHGARQQNALSPIFRLVHRTTRSQSQSGHGSTQMGQQIWMGHMIYFISLSWRVATITLFQSTIYASVDFVITFVILATLKNYDWHWHWHDQYSVPVTRWTVIKLSISNNNISNFIVRPILYAVIAWLSEFIVN